MWMLSNKCAHGHVHKPKGIVDLACTRCSADPMRCVQANPVLTVYQCRVGSRWEEPMMSFLIFTFYSNKYAATLLKAITYNWCSTFVIRTLGSL